jgi:DNA-directed RNA polymerase subunit M/transcription elongation factor TFIIS
MQEQSRTRGETEHSTETRADQDQTKAQKNHRREKTKKTRSGQEPEENFYRCHAGMMAHADPLSGGSGLSHSVNPGA